MTAGAQAAPAKPRADQSNSTTILRAGGVSMNPHRLDRQGNTIMKGGTHHLTYCDQQEPKRVLADVQEVQAYKNGQQGCYCTIS
mmetsp:Transcript_93894/g.265228  ORF Transcript_93894/g.265228 Transcript_93894/m.265228 type:complete len:84 (-) Transcript_93894:133-384(-)|eukprot:CAMPEP_0117507024 /NCGR_PEP_ID=MMETSP0784-20121206/26213_1 /TAXON_ID=39447 /ORGANISM="" /LENGTH=83 /DNA_ID=CAMNT_0005302521 /DNA_START=63 /DNA_END=314 /DNA_ORIENTATION=+